MIPYIRGEIGRDEPRRGFRWLARLDAVVNRLYGAQWNPLYHSGAIAIAMLVVLIVTGVYLLLFYRIGAPYASVVRINEVWFNRWVQGVHRFASDVAVVAGVIHAFRMYAQRRTWGPRALAWVSGVVLVGVLLVSGWTGYVLVWDTQAQLLAMELVRMLDALPVFSEPIGRSFSGESAVPSAFFFINLFAHIALPIGVGVLVWVHVARVARPVLFPSRRVLGGALLAVALLALVWPLRMSGAADALRIPETVPLDWFYNFWLPVTLRLPAVAVWLGGVALVALLCAVPWLTKPRALPAPATVNERACTGCEQCVADCPYDAIEMVAGIARVKEELCTACGICVGSCAPMAIGPMDRTARDQLADVRAFLAQHKPAPGDVIIVGCTWSAASAAADDHGAKFFPVPCVGSLHTSTVERLLRGGAGGVLVVGCPAHDGRTREGVDWAQARLFEGRKAELKERVDKDRVRLVQATLGEHAALHAAALAFADDIAALEREPVDVVALCRGPEAVA